MDAVDSLRPDSILGDSEQLSTETPRQDPQRSCTRTTTCHQQGCMICVTPTNHVRNLDQALNNNNNPRTLPIAADHTIVNLTNCFRIVLQEKTLNEIQPLNEFYLESRNPTWNSTDMTALNSAPSDRLPWNSSTPTSPHPLHYLPHPQTD